MDLEKIVKEINVEKYLTWHSQMYSGYVGFEKIFNEVTGRLKNEIDKKDRNKVWKNNLEQKLRLLELEGIEIEREEGELPILKPVNNVYSKELFKSIYINKQDFQLLTVMNKMKLEIFEDNSSRLLIGVLPEQEVLKLETEKVWKEGRKNILGTCHLVLFPIPILKENYEMFVNGMTDIGYLQYLNVKIMELESKKQTFPAVRFQWMGEQIELVTLLADLMETDLLKASKTDIAKLLENCFVDKEKKPFTYSYSFKILKPNEEKSKKRIDLKPLL